MIKDAAIMLNSGQKDVGNMLRSWSACMFANKHNTSQRSLHSYRTCSQQLSLHAVVCYKSDESSAGTSTMSNLRHSRSRLRHRHTAALLVSKLSHGSILSKNSHFRWKA